jgi:hypothetical protein
VEAVQQQLEREVEERHWRVCGGSVVFFWLFWWDRKWKYAGDAHDYIGSFYGLNVSKAC